MSKKRKETEDRLSEASGADSSNKRRVNSDSKGAKALLSPHSEPNVELGPGPVPPVRPTPGRPKHSKRPVRSDTGPTAILSGLIPPRAPSTPPPHKPKKAKSGPKGSSNVYSPHTGQIASPSRPRESQTAILPKKVRGKKNGKPRRRKADSQADESDTRPPLKLNHIKHSEQNHWISAGSCHTSKAYQLFEDWKNDYSPEKYFQPRSIKIIHASDPADRKKDIRARPFALCWDTPDFRPPAGISAELPVPIFRILYKCLGHCRHGSGDSEEGSGDSDSEDNSSSDSESETVAPPLKKRKTNLEPIDPNSDKVRELNKILDSGSIPKKKPVRRKCPVQLHAEVYSDDLSRIHFFQRHRHQAAEDQYLDMSPHIRQCIIEMASLYNLPASSIKRRLLRVFTEDTEHPTPSYRRPNSFQVNNAVNYNRRKDRLFTDPLLNIGVFARHNPDKIFHYTPPNYDTNPPSQFATGIHHVYGTQSALLWGGRNGVGYDSTWANMNENRAPLTVLTTINKEGCMVPCFAYLSANITIPTQTAFLEEAKGLVEKMAQDLLDGSVQIAEGHKDFQDELLAQARFVVESSDGWRPAFFMIDKSRSAKGAIENVFPGIVIRICQFHVMQAILRWERDHGESGEHLARPSLSLFRKHQLLYAVRELQRCRRPGEWERYTQCFRQRLDAIAEGSSTSANHLWRYFESNWFTDEWRAHWTDMGLPAGANRDGMLSTNNWTERAFKTFHQVFLGNRTNKSAYRLVLILANEWFQYYQSWKPAKRVNQAALDIATAAHQLWSSTNTIQPFTLTNGNQAWRVANY